MQDIFNNILRNQESLARQDPNWASYSAEERLRRAAEYGINNVIRQRELNRRRIALTILARDRVDNQIADMMARGVAKNEVEALNRLLAYNPDNKTGFQAMDTRATATRNIFLGPLLDQMDNAGLLSLFERENQIQDLVREMYGENTGNAGARAAAELWARSAEQLRTAFNNAGGDIGRLENWNLPQEHSQYKTAMAGCERWLDDILPAIDRQQYVHPDGSLMNDAEVRELFTHIYDTISTGGANKLQGSGHRISSMTANRHAESRQIFFRDADSFLNYHAQYGERGIFDIMVGHISGLSRDIATIETFGPNPTLMFRSVLDDAIHKSTMTDRVGKTSIENLARKTSDLYDFVSGNYKPLVRSRVASVFDSLRNLLTGSRLGSAAVTSITDQGTLLLMAKTNGMALGPAYKAMVASLKPLNRNDRHYALRNGLALESALSSLNRWGVDNMGTNWTSKAASTVLRLSGLMKISDAAKEGYAASMMSSLGHVVTHNDSLNSLTNNNNFDAELIRRHGVTDTDYAVWRMAELDRWAGVDNILSPESILAIPDNLLSNFDNPETVRFEAARKLIGMLSEEADMAVITPGTRDRLRIGAGLQRGTASGEIARSIAQFKAFPFALVARMWARGTALPSRLQKAYFGGSLLLATTLFGAAALQINNIASGRKPQDMDDTGFWIEAMLKGGALGVYGDFIFSDKNSYGATMGEMAIGPLGSSLTQFADLTLGNARRAMAGDDTHVGADAVRFVKGLTPGANLWYTKAVTDHLLFNQLQEAVSPGYLEKYTQRQQNTYGREFWWKPNDVLPRGQ
ncbi:hypothetical protein [Gilliamella sp. B3367]|uniref:hypothetical protein n=1 Tax=Gilliamella sp. B3367 TaxID=2817989 RepID=UPI0022699A89|nr:hypothetical protein [Gilliamella sp. B3367]MCX8594397.1 hypothetical protein [Gilliamella sp. B3367]